MSHSEVLIIEDEAGIRDTLKEVLELEGFEVFTAENGRAGLDLLGRLGAPCLILLDLMMPVMDGWQFLEEIKTPGHRWADVPVAVVSAVADTSLVERRYNVAVMKKPFNIVQLLDLTQQFCRAS